MNAVTIPYVPPKDDGVIQPSDLDSAIDAASSFIGGVVAAFVHPEPRVAFVLVGRRLFATVENRSDDSLFEIRLARYEGRAASFAKKLRAQGYEEMGT